MESISNVLKPMLRADVVIFTAQVVLLFIVVITSLVNLSISNGNTNLWQMVLTSCLGYMMPSPQMKAKDNRIQATAESNPKDGETGIVLRDLTFEREEPIKRAH